MSPNFYRPCVCKTYSQTLKEMIEIEAKFLEFVVTHYGHGSMDCSEISGSVEILVEREGGYVSVVSTDGFKFTGPPCSGLPVVLEGLETTIPDINLKSIEEALLSLSD